MILQQYGGALLATLTAVLITAGPTAMNAQTKLASYRDFAHLPKSGGLPAGVLQCVSSARPARQHLA